MGFTASTLILGLFVLFVLSKDCNYTSVDPWVLSFIFLPTAIVGFRSILRTGPRRLAILACMSGLAGMSYLYYLYHTGRMVSYMEMIWRSKNGQWNP